MVCGSGPSEASTRTTTPSTMLRMRSTSPPKSAWPGVSTMLMRVSFQTEGGALGEDGDAALALEVVGIHGPLFDPLVLAERAGLPEQHVDQRGLAMVDVRDDRDVSQVHQRLCARKRCADLAHRAPARQPAAFTLIAAWRRGAGCRATRSRPRWRARRWETAPPARMCKVSPPVPRSTNAARSSPPGQPVRPARCCSSRARASVRPGEAPGS